MITWRVTDIPKSLGIFRAGYPERPFFKEEK